MMLSVIFGSDCVCRPEAAGEEAAVLGVVSEQPQGELGVLDVSVRQQQQVPEAARRRQQAESSQGPPQLGAAPYWRGALTGRREAELNLSRYSVTSFTRITTILHPLLPNL